MTVTWENIYQSFLKLKELLQTEGFTTQAEKQLKNLHYDFSNFEKQLRELLANFPEGEGYQQLPCENCKDKNKWFVKSEKELGLK